MRFTDEWEVTKQREREEREAREKAVRELQEAAVNAVNKGVGLYEAARIVQNTLGVRL